MIIQLAFICLGGLVAYFVVRDAVRDGIRQALKDHQLWLDGHVRTGDTDGSRR